MPKKVSEWLNEREGHGIYDANLSGKAFVDETGQAPRDWPIHTTKQTQQIMKARGLGGELTASADSQLVYGYELAAVLARQYANDFRSIKMGRGSSFSDCVEAIRTAGN